MILCLLELSYTAIVLPIMSEKKNTSIYLDLYRIDLEVYWKVPA